MNACRRLLLALALVASGCDRGSPNRSAVGARGLTPFECAPIVLRGSFSTGDSIPPENLHLYLRLDLSALSIAFPPSQGWGFRVFRLTSCKCEKAILSLSDMRRKDGALQRAALTGRGTIFDVLIAFRVTKDGHGSSSQRSEVVIDAIREDGLEELGRATLPASSSPSRDSTEGRWLDSESEFDQSDTGDCVGDLPPFIRREDWADYRFQRVEVIRSPIEKDPTTLGVVSWNGAHSLDVVGVRSPAYNGLYSIMTMMDDATSERTSGRLPEWPEPVWLLEAAASE